MLTIRRFADRALGAAPRHTLTLSFDERKKSRLRAQLDDGGEVGLMLERGTVLRGGDLLETDDGQVVLVRAAAEKVSTVRTRNGRALARAAYHLGNRHVPLEVGENWVRYEHDHVLDDLVVRLGLVVVVEFESFEPEGGSYRHEHHPETVAADGRPHPSHGERPMPSLPGTGSEARCAEDRVK